MPTVSLTLIYIGYLADIDPDETNSSNEHCPCCDPLKRPRFWLEFSELGEEWRRMKTSKFTDAQKAFIINQDEEGTTVLRSAAKLVSTKRSTLTGRKNTQAFCRQT
jgi:hypothetical protein